MCRVALLLERWSAWGHLGPQHLAALRRDEGEGRNAPLDRVRASCVWWPGLAASGARAAVLCAEQPRVAAAERRARRARADRSPGPRASCASAARAPAVVTGVVGGSGLVAALVVVAVALGVRRVVVRARVGRLVPAPRSRRHCALAGVRARSTGCRGHCAECRRCARASVGSIGASVVEGRRTAGSSS